MTEEETQQIVQVHDEQDKQLLVDLAGECGARVKDVHVRTLDLVTFVEIIGGVTVLRLIIERWQDRRQGGQVIDLRADAKKIVYRDRGLLFGYVLMMLADGRVEVQVNDRDRLSEIVDRLVAAFSKSDAGTTVDKAVPIVQALVGRDAQVRIEPSDPTAENANS
ncbi:hypothetical protein LWC34_17210 [Kibdelosporangium philippinense]|uniref:TLP18.3, Psb32 and MOLO-1 founding protein of phosphatase n=1 Tax=Kibdelosporangium philippinense TaxID=211113 RepID=A0ABS8ZAW2_9PSEU|nr:hypothetical protein [Kibdelosporangium philippinense]MCE7004552.1 hypothetical protein [Kibdelosporangium philippinense]